MRNAIIAIAIPAVLLLSGCEGDENNNAPVSTAKSTNGYQTQPEYRDSAMNENDYARERRDHMNAPSTSRWHSTITPSVGFVRSSNGTPNYTPPQRKEYVDNNQAQTENTVSTGNQYADQMNMYHWHNSARLVPAFNKEVLARANGKSVLAEYVPNPNNVTPGCPCGIWVRYSLGNHRSMILARVKHWMNIPKENNQQQRTDFGGL